MTKIDMAALLADREAGTDDPWEVIDGNTHGSEIIAPAQPSVRRNVAKCGGPNRESNARRIARLPELEAAYIEAVDALRNIANGSSAEAASYARHILGEG